MRTLVSNTFFFLISLAVCIQTTDAQSSNRDPDIRHRLEMIEKGQIEAVRSELPALMTNYQNNAGVIYLQAVLTTDGSEAAKLYQSIIDNFPKSEWADDAMYKLYQYYYSIGLYKTAEQKLNRLKEDYPFSAYAAEQSPVSEEKPIPKEKPAEVKPVEVKPIEEKPAVIKTPGTIPKFATNFTVQVGAFSTLQNASELKAKFEKEGLSSNIFTIVSQGKKLHKVWVGEFQTYEEAKKLTVEIKQKFNLSSMVVSR